MLILAKLVGMVIVVMGMLIAFNPNVFKTIMNFWRQGKNIYIAGVARLLFGTIFLLAAPMCRIPLFISILGGLMIIGGILSPITPGKTIYEWYVCGLDQLYKDLYPSVLATWAALEYAATHGIPKFDFMGVGLPDRDYGVRDFKARFGGELVNFGRFARINNKAIYTIAELGYNALAWMKKV